MYTKKIMLFTSLCFMAISYFTITGCKKGCTNEDPRARIVNNANYKSDVQIKTTGGNTVNINNVLPKTTSAYNSFAAGQVTFTINVNQTNIVKVFALDNCFEYDIVIDSTNNVTSVPTARP